MLSLLLIALLASCPIVCGTLGAITGHDGHQHMADGGPLPAPVNDDCCACNGALAASFDVQVNALGGDHLPTGWAWGLTWGLDGLSSASSDLSAASNLLPPPPDGPRLPSGSARTPHLRC